MGSDLLTVREAAQYLRVSESWLRHKGVHRPRRVRFGNSVLYRLSALNEFIDESEETHGKEQHQTAGSR